LDRDQGKQPRARHDAGFRRQLEQLADFASLRLPTKLGDVSVTVDGKPAYVYFYCSSVTSTVCQEDQIMF